MAMHIDRKLNLVVPIEREDGTSVYVHSTPISKEVFEKYFLVISKAFTAIYDEGLHVLGGPRVAHMMLRKVATDAGVWSGENGVELGLMNEIRRLSNVIVLTENGWKPMPLDSALARETLTDEEVSEAEGAIVFFILVSAMHKRNQVRATLQAMETMWDTLSTLYNCTEYAQLLPISTEIEISQVPAASSVAY